MSQYSTLASIMCHNGHPDEMNMSNSSLLQWHSIIKKFVYSAISCVLSKRHPFILLKSQENSAEKKPERVQ